MFISRDGISEMAISLLIRYLWIFILVLASFSCQSATAQSAYYVDAANGSDSQPGTSPLSAWKTIARVNAATFVAGDRILFKRGQTWREQLTVPSSGSTGSPIIFTAYGAGALPVISGAEIQTTWKFATGHVWWTSNLSANATSSIYFNDMAGTHKSSKADLSNDKDWYAPSIDSIWIYSAIDPNTRIIERANRDVCILVNNKSYITIDNIWVMKARHSGSIGPGEEANIFVKNKSPHVTIQNCTSSGGSYAGFRFEHSSDFGTVRNCTVGDLAYYDNTNAGIMLGVWGSANTACANMVAANNTVHNVQVGFQVYYIASARIDSNQISNCYQSGLGSSWDDSLVFRYNTVHDVCTVTEGNGLNVGGAVGSSTTNSIIAHNTIYNVFTRGGASDGNGIEIDIGCRRVRCFDNIIHNIEGAGICTYRADSSSVYDNILYHTGFGASTDSVFKCGIYVSDGSKTITFYNNTIYNPTFWGVHISGNSGSDSTLRISLKNNIVSGSLNSALRIRNQYVSTANLVLDYNDWHFTSGCMSYWKGKIFSTFEDYKTGSGLDAHSISSDPLFVNAGAYNLELQLTSPCINAGTNVGLTQDFAGNPVPSGRVPDIGAFQVSDVSAVGSKQHGNEGDGVRLEQNYPNPFNPSTTIRYWLPERVNVQLIVYDSVGRQIRILVSGNQEAGFHDARFEGSRLASGVYFYRLSAANHVETKRLTLMK